MCGINGIIHVRNMSDAKDRLASMCELSKHRGPDYTGYHEDEDAVLGHNRLSIIDLNEAANQPFYSPDKNLVLVFNGEIYNYRELKEQLTSFEFKTESDTEVVMAAFLQWGVSALNRFNGMFALALWDVQQAELLLARDRLGIKPLYYSDNDVNLVFSSEIRSLMESGLVERKIDEASLVDYLRYQTVHAPKTIVEGVSMLMPGHYMIYREDGPEIRKYWDINTAYSKKSERQSLDEIHSEIVERLEESVRKRLVADVPFGAFLSGGIDSSAVVALMSRHNKKPVKTFSVTFAEEEFSEAPYARMIAEKYGTEHTEIKLSPKDFLNDLPHALDAMDHPSGDGPNSYIVSKVTKEHGVTMALSGLGGDELFAGYDIFRRSWELSNKKWLFSFPPSIRNVGTALLKKLKPGIASDKIAEILSKDYLELPYFYPVNRLVFTDATIRRLLGKKKLLPNPMEAFGIKHISHEGPGFNVPFLSKVSFMEISTYMQNVLLRDTDQMSMAHALEVRVPFLDHELLEYVYGVADQHKFPHSPKQLLVDALGDALPREIVDRKKMGFTLPWKMWMKEELKPFCEEQLNFLKENGVFETKPLDTMWNKFLNDDKRITWSRMWSLVVLGYWMKKNNLVYRG